jgi:hypothetical protein
LNPEVDGIKSIAPLQNLPPPEVPLSNDASSDVVLSSNILSLKVEDCQTSALDAPPSSASVLAAAVPRSVIEGQSSPCTDTATVAHSLPVNPYIVVADIPAVVCDTVAAASNLCAPPLVVDDAVGQEAIVLTSNTQNSFATSVIHSLQSPSISDTRPVQHCSHAAASLIPSPPLYSPRVARYTPQRPGSGSRIPRSIASALLLGDNDLRDALLLVGSTETGVLVEDAAALAAAAAEVEGTAAAVGQTSEEGYEGVSSIGSDLVEAMHEGCSPQRSTSDAGASSNGSGGGDARRSRSSGLSNGSSQHDLARSALSDSDVDD